MKSLLYVVSEFFDGLLARDPVWVAAISAALLANAMTTLGPLDHTSRALDDLLIRRAPVALPAARVLLVELPPAVITALSAAEHPDNRSAVLDLTAAIERLRGLGARQMAINLMPENASTLIADALTHDDVLFGRRFSPSPAGAKSRRLDGVLESLPDEYRPLSDRTGVLTSPVLEFGVARKRRLFSQVGNEILPALESLLASRSGGEAMPFDRGAIRIDFRGDADRLPILDFERVLSGDVLATLVEGRAILIGAGSTAFEPGVATPRSRDGELLSVLQYRGYVVDTLLRGTPLSRSWPISTALIGCASLLGAAIGRAFSPRAAVVASIGAGFTYTVAAWLSLGLLEFHLPTIELITAQPLACAFVLASRHVVERGELRRAARRSTALVRALPELPHPPPESSTPWHRLARLLKTSVGFERLLLLEVTARGERAREVYCEGFETDPDRLHDLAETPYAEMIQTNLARELTEKCFAASSPRSAQFLLPLTDGGRWLGFGIVEPIGYGPECETEMLRALREIAPLSGRLLAQWQRTPDGDGLRSNRADLGPNRNAGEGEARRLEANALSLYRRIETLHKILEDGSVAISVFDQSGFVLQSNRRMNTIATEYDIALADIDPSEFITRLTGFKRERTQTMVRLVLMEGRKHVIAIRPVGDRQTRTLHLLPLKRPVAEGPDPSHPFPVQGILIEIIDDEVAHQYHRHLARVGPIAERASLEIDRLAASIDKLAGEIDFDSSALGGLAQSAAEAVAALRKDLANPPQAGMTDPALIEASGPLERTIKQHSTECARRGIAIVFDKPDRPVFVETPEASFQDLLEASVSLLVRDAMDSSTLILQIVEGQDQIEFELRNQGYGMPSNILRKGLSEIDDGSLADLTRIRRALPDVEAVGADFTISSVVGDGICIGLILPRAL